MREEILSLFFANKIIFVEKGFFIEFIVIFF
ncbi:hypothetical protein KIS1582_0668 [Cytobacillus firmus]|uniref:Uncharacterized protein n=1 Tax=Cytobacillus firmus TaxID=1399 RepID=A0A380XZB9_CYTFI|nr:hypothetical protein KIS1582_0668 [Cytobacillus firmus]SUV08212.1 Uncharacterised protein [Cytobacillus firmus]